MKKSRRNSSLSFLRRNKAPLIVFGTAAALIFGMAEWGYYRSLMARTTVNVVEEGEASPVLQTADVKPSGEAVQIRRKLVDEALRVRGVTGMAAAMLATASTVDVELMEGRMVPAYNASDLLRVMAQRGMLPPGVTPLQGATAQSEESVYELRLTRAGAFVMECVATPRHEGGAAYIVRLDARDLVNSVRMWRASGTAAVPAVIKPALLQGQGWEEQPMRESGAKPEEQTKVLASLRDAAAKGGK